MSYGRLAEDENKAEIHRQLGLRLTYDCGKHKVLAEMTLDQHSREACGLSKSVRGPTRPLRTCHGTADEAGGGIGGGKDYGS
ncbi:hypothetical protein GCM10009577_74140 [Streptomyces javensis]